MTPESPAPLTPTTPKERAVMRAYCAKLPPHSTVVQAAVNPNGWIVFVPKETSYDRRIPVAEFDFSQKDEAEFYSASREDFPRVLADLEWALERIAKAPHAPDCASNTRRQVIPFETFTAATCKSMFGCGHCEKCRWIQNNQVFTSGKCNCWKSEVRGKCMSQ